MKTLLRDEPVEKPGLVETCLKEKFSTYPKDNSSPILLLRWEKVFDIVMASHALVFMGDIENNQIVE